MPEKTVKMLSPEAAERTSNQISRAAPYVTGAMNAIPLGLLGAHRGIQSGKKYGLPIGALLGSGLGFGIGYGAYKLLGADRNYGKSERNAANTAIRAAKRQGYTPELVDSWWDIDRDKVRQIIRDDAQAKRKQASSGLSSDLWYGFLTELNKIASFRKALLESGTTLVPTKPFKQAKNVEEAISFVPSKSFSDYATRLKAKDSPVSFSEV